MSEQASIATGYLKNRKVCVTGRLLTLTHRELEAFIHAHGGQFLAQPIRSGFTLIVGDTGWPTINDDPVTKIFRDARKLQTTGYPIEFLTEEQFLDRLGLHDSAAGIRGPHSLADISKLLDVSIVRLRRWMRDGLIEPTKILHHIPYFDFQQVSRIKQLQRIIESGVPIKTIREGLESARQWMSEDDQIGSRWSQIDTRGNICFRWEEKLVDQRGQLHFDFDPPAASTNSPSSLHSPTSLHPPTSLHSPSEPDLFNKYYDIAIELEDQSQWDEALIAYDQAISVDSNNPYYHWGRGNLLLTCGRAELALASFLEAVEMDPQFASAWTGIGIAYHRLGLLDRAEESLRRSIEISPRNAESHRVLSEILAQCGQTEQSQLEAQLFEKYGATESIQRASQLMRSQIESEAS